MREMSFADTLTTFLYTLSHPSELSEEGGEEKKTSASVIFILDSFDEFLSHPRQALLYNLFDIAQSRKAPIAVICLGRQVNAIDGLEKRVKSRFGGRIKQVSRPTELEEFWKVCEAALSVEDPTSAFAEKWNAHIQVQSTTVEADDRDYGRRVR
jgi:origin recognition complex subunit 4